MKSRIEVLESKGRFKALESYSALMEMMESKCTLARISRETAYMSVTFTFLSLNVLFINICD